MLKTLNSQQPGSLGAIRADISSQAQIIGKRISLIVQEQDSPQYFGYKYQTNGAAEALPRDQN